MFDDLFWDGKKLIFTRHFKKELEMLGKFEEFALYILENGEHNRISKRQDKYKVLRPYRKEAICLVYAFHEDSVILIHIKPTNRK